MARQVSDIKSFIEISRRKDARSARIKKSVNRSTRASTTKFKIRCSKYLYTFSTTDQEKADKLKQALPPTLNVQEIDKVSKPKKK